MAAQLGRLDQAHHRCGALTTPKRTSKQPIVSPNRNRPNLVLHPVIVYWQLAISQELS
jgi:hypothetical protein